EAPGLDSLEDVGGLDGDDAGDLDRQLLDPVVVHRADPGPPVDEGVPGAGNVTTDGAGDAPSGEYDGGVRHEVSSGCVERVSRWSRQPWARSMNATASPTVLRFFTSSSGIETPNFSSAPRTTSTMDSESTSRSSMNDLSSCTSSASMPATSLTISARSARISSV